MLVCNNLPYFLDLGFYLVLEFGDSLKKIFFFHFIMDRIYTNKNTKYVKNILEKKCKTRHFV